jgi:hypothetical protein
MVHFSGCEMPCIMRMQSLGHDSTPNQSIPRFEDTKNLIRSPSAVFLFVALEKF